MKRSITTTRVELIGESARKRIYITSMVGNSGRKCSSREINATQEARNKWVIFTARPFRQNLAQWTCRYIILCPGQSVAHNTGDSLPLPRSSAATTTCTQSRSADDNASQTCSEK